MYVLDQKQENYVYPCKPQFFYIKVGFTGVYISRTCFPDAWFEAQKASFKIMPDKTLIKYRYFTDDELP